MTPIVNPTGLPDPLDLGARLAQLLATGRRVSTYKLAVLDGLLQFSLEHPVGAGDVLAISIPELAETVVETYWPQVRPYGTTGMLRQNEQARDGVRTIPDTVRQLRSLAADRGVSTPAQLRDVAPREWGRELRRTAVKIAQLPLFHLQKTGGRAPGTPFLYDDEWLRAVTVSELERRSWQLELYPGVAHAMARVSSLLQPVIQQWWVDDVQRLNSHELDAPDLHGFLFGADRTAIAHLADPLRELQDNKCFYCHRPLPRAVHVDHVLPWSRVAIDGLANLVVADPRCNGDKSAALPILDHVERVLRRPPSDLAAVASSRRWPVETVRVRRTARGLYGTTPPGTPLWQEPGVYSFSTSAPTPF